MRGSLLGALESDRRKRKDRKRKDKAQRLADDTPPDQAKAHRTCVLALAELPEPRDAPTVVTKIQRSILEFISLRERGLY